MNLLRVGRALLSREGPMTVGIYVDTAKQVGAFKGLCQRGRAEIWFEQHDREGVTFEYEVKQ